MVVLLWLFWLFFVFLNQIFDVCNQSQQVCEDANMHQSVNRGAGRTELCWNAGVDTQPEENWDNSI